jgi:AcrR family transcriptional regulator
MLVDDARRVLARVAAQSGGIRALAAELNISERLLRQYIEGKEPVPDGLFLRVVDVILKRLPEPPTN